ncbi:MAG: ABC transporter ATP-binding protein [Synechococcaceae cyanobacterium SM2_3_2]|nr:ABC transporter ATP-binding protein [Synechococcaceae cyanobacterium SM2_3_2]
MPDPSALATQNLSLSYERTRIVENLSFGIPRGEIAVLVGPNGCGKSTILRGLARLLKPQAGTVLLDGSDIHRLSTRSIAQNLGILPQGPVAPEGLTVKDLVAQGRYPHQSWWQQWSVQDEEMTLNALETTGLLDLMDRPLDQLSGGQRQRAWIAMTLAQNTPILLLDEPTTFLDLAHQMEVLELLAHLNQEQKRTVIMVLHDLNQAARYAHHLVAIKQGSVFAQGSPWEVVTEGMVQEVFGLGCRIISDPVAGSPMCIPVARRSRQPALGAGIPVRATASSPESAHPQ